MQAFARPTTLAQAVALLAEVGGRVLAGGTDLFPTAGQRLSGPVVDVTAIPDLSQITLDGDLRVGACVTWSQIAKAQLPQACRALQQAARQVGGQQIQNQGTIGGNLCNASPAADGVPPLLVLDAEIELTSPLGSRRLALAEFLTGPRKTARKSDEILTAVVVPERALAGRSDFQKLGARSYLVISIAMVAARVSIENGHIRDCFLAVGACSATACRLPSVERAVIGKTPEQAADLVDPDLLFAALAPIDDVRATADYRHQAAVELLRRALREAVA